MARNESTAHALRAPLLEAWARQDETTVRSLIASLPVRLLPVLDSSLRSYSVRWDPGGSRRSWLASMHPSGFVRQAALPDLSIPLLYLRTQDWVAPVRQEAAAQVLRTLVADHAPAWTAALPLLHTLRERARKDGDLESAILAFLRTQTEALRAGARSAEVIVRRICLQLLDDWEAGLHDADLGIRRWAYTRAADRWRDALRDPHPSLRLAALEQVEWAPHCVPLLADRSAPVRELARRRYAADPGTLYRPLIAKGRYLPGAIAGLGESGAVDDIETIGPFLADPRTRIRRAAFQALGRLGWRPEPQWLLRCAAGEQRSIAILALRVLLRDHPAIDLLTLSATVRYDLHPSLLRMAIRRNKWEYLELILDTGSESAYTQWSARYNRSQSPLGEERRERLVQALQTTSLPAPILKTIQFLISRQS